MKNPVTPELTRGAAPFVDDLPEPVGLLHGAVFTSPLPHGHIRSLATTRAAAMKGVAAVLTASDIPGANQIGGIIQDEPLLADGEVHFVGQPIALVLAADRRTARRAAAAIEADIEPLPPVFDPRQAQAAGNLIAPSRTIELGDVEAAWPRCKVVVSGRVETGSQEHVYLETQSAMAVPGEAGRMVVHSATQSLSLVQRVVARVLGVPMHAVEVDVRRLGGAFGGKEDQATAWACLAALGAWRTGRAVKVVLSRGEDMRLTGKRHPYSADFRIGLDRDGRILAYEVTLFQNAGAAADLSTAILERSMFHATGSYFVPNARVTAHCCRTNLPPFTAFRGFGAPQAMLVMEAAIARAAEKLGMQPAEVQRRNLLADGDELPFGMKVESSRARRAFTQAEERYDVAGLAHEVARYNREHRERKRGVALMPVCFGISFTNTWLNQGSALVHVYTDGSVAVSTGAVEMGQGVNQKITAVVVRTLGIAPERVRLESTNTGRTANTSPTAASSGADLNGRAAELACQPIAERLLRVAAELLGCSVEAVSFKDDQVLVGGVARELTWPQLVWQAYTRRVSLSSQAHYATPGIFYDKIKEKGQPFAYHVFGTAVVEASVDGLRGTARVDRVRVVHDGGASLDPLVDRGQMEGGLLQGIGWMTMEEVVYRQGRLLTDSLTTYKVPDLHSAPEVEVAFLANVDNPAAVLGSKAIGEPPFMYGIGAFFAIRAALRAFRPERELPLETPLTAARILRFLHGPVETEKAPAATNAREELADA